MAWKNLMRIVRMDRVSNAWRFKRICFLLLVWLPTSLAYVLIVIDHIFLSKELDAGFAIVSSTMDYCAAAGLVGTLVAYEASGSLEVALNLFNCIALLVACAKSWYYKYTIATGAPVFIFALVPVLSWSFGRRTTLKVATAVVSLSLLCGFMAKDAAVVSWEHIGAYWKSEKISLYVCYMYAYWIICMSCFYAAIGYNYYVEHRLNVCLGALERCLKTMDVSGLRVRGWVKTSAEEIIERVCDLLRVQMNWLKEGYAQALLGSNADSETTGSSSVGDGPSAMGGAWGGEQTVVLCRMSSIRCKHAEKSSCCGCIEKLYRKIRASRLCLEENVFLDEVYVSSNISRRRVDVAEPIAQAMRIKRDIAREAQVEMQLSVLVFSAQVHLLKIPDSYRVGILSGEWRERALSMGSILPGCNACLANGGAWRAIRGNNAFKGIRLDHPLDGQFRVYCVSLHESAAIGAREWMYDARIDDKTCVGAAEDLWDCIDSGKWNGIAHAKWEDGIEREVRGVFGESVALNVGRRVDKWKRASNPQWAGSV